jgi:hypothetical protein
MMPMRADCKRYTVIVGSHRVIQLPVAGEQPR